MVGNGKPGLKARVAAKEKEIDPRLMSRFTIGVPTSGEYREEIILRVGKYGPFLEQGERSILDDVAHSLGSLVEVVASEYSRQAY